MQEGGGPLRSAPKARLTFTGFSSSEKEQLRQLVSHLDAKYLPELVHFSTSPHGFSTHLVCKTLLDAFGTPKYIAALEWGVPVVTLQWIHDCIQHGKLLPVDKYKTDTLASPGNILGRLAPHMLAHNAQQPRQGRQQQGVHVHALRTKGDVQQRTQAHGRCALGDIANVHQRAEPGRRPNTPSTTAPITQARSLPQPKPLLQQRQQQGMAQRADAIREPPFSNPRHEFSFSLGGHAAEQAAPAAPVWPTHAVSGTTCVHTGTHATPLAPNPSNICTSPLPVGMEVSSPSFGNMGMGMGDGGAGATARGTGVRGGSIDGGVNGVPGKSGAGAEPLMHSFAGLAGMRPQHEYQQTSAELDMIIPGTQAPDDDFDDPVSPQSLLTYLKNKMTLGGGGGNTGGAAGGRGTSGLSASSAASALAADEAESAPGEGVDGVDAMLVSPAPAACAARAQPHLARCLGERTWAGEEQQEGLGSGACGDEELDMGMDISPLPETARQRQAEADQSRASAAGRAPRPSLLYSGFSGDLCSAATPARCKLAAEHEVADTPSPRGVSPGAVQPKSVEADGDSSAVAAAAAAAALPLSGCDGRSDGSAQGPCGMHDGRSAAATAAVAAAAHGRPVVSAPAPPDGALSAFTAMRQHQHRRSWQAAAAVVKPEPEDDNTGSRAVPSGACPADGRTTCADGGSSGTENAGASGSEGWRDALEDGDSDAHSTRLHDVIPSSQEDSLDDEDVPDFSLHVAQPGGLPQPLPRRLRRLQRRSSQSGSDGGHRAASTGGLRLRSGGGELEDDVLQDSGVEEEDHAGDTLQDSGVEEDHAGDTLQDSGMEEDHAGDTLQDSGVEEAQGQEHGSSDLRECETTRDLDMEAAGVGVHAARRGGSSERDRLRGSGLQDPGVGEAGEARGGGRSTNGMATCAQLLLVKAEPGIADGDVGFGAPGPMPQAGASQAHTMPARYTAQAQAATMPASCYPASQTQPSQSAAQYMTPQVRHSLASAAQPHAEMAAGSQGVAQPAGRGSQAAAPGVRSVAAKALASARAARGRGDSGVAADRSGAAVAIKPDPEAPGGDACAVVATADRDACAVVATADGPVQDLQARLHALASGATLLARLDVSVEASNPEVDVTKPSKRPPQGTTLRAFHGLGSTKGMEFADEASVNPPGVKVVCRARTKRVRYPLIVETGSNSSSNSSCGGAVAAAAEPVVLYRLPCGEWWLEYHPLLNGADALSHARTVGRRAVLPNDLAAGAELLRSLERRHARLANVVGDVQVVRSKKLPAKLERGTLYQRHVWDAEAMAVLTDAPVSEFVL